MENKILKGEVYSKLNVILKHYYYLLNQEFPSDGSRSLTLLIISIIEKLIARFAYYNQLQIKHICKCSAVFEEFCGNLNESEISKVPWSIIPAIENLFQNLMPEYQFVIGPIWASNYMIFNRNILEYLSELIINVPDLLFEANESFSSNVNSFLSVFPKGIYLIFFPRIERKSSLHFSLLGHEIGHSYSLIWLKNNFNKVITEQDLENKFRKIAEKEVKQIDPNNNMPIVNYTYIENNVRNYQTIASNILNELIADIFGTYLFGETSLIATYIYSIKTNPDDTKSWQKGYLSWRYRLKMINSAIKFIHGKYSKISYISKSKWEEPISKCLMVDYQDGKEDGNDYLKEILISIDVIQNTLFSDVEEHIKALMFYNFIDDPQIFEARKRLSNYITPNAYLHDKKEIPIDLRNILYATWLEFCDNIQESPEDYEYISNVINLLSIKGIELSVEQGNFYDFIKK